MPDRCVAANCSSTPCAEKGISLHKIPFYESGDPESKRRRKKWVDFVRQKRKFTPSQYSVICSLHFKPEDFERMFTTFPGQSSTYLPKLRTDEKGICVFPSIQVEDKKGKSPLSKRARRRVSFPNSHGLKCRQNL